MATIEYARAARDDLYSIREDLESKNLAAARHYADLFDKAFDLLERLPRAGRERPDLGRPGLRSIPVSQYIVVYRVKGTVVRIVRVVHGARDLPRLF